MLEGKISSPVSVNNYMSDEERTVEMLYLGGCMFIMLFCCLMFVYLLAMQL